MSARYYDKTGRMVSEVPAKKGGFKTPTVRDAEQLGLVPSVTTILGMIAKPHLTKWKCMQVLHAAATLPEIAGESLDDWAARVWEDAEEQSETAKDMGSQIHNVCEMWAKSKTPTEDESLRLYQRAFAVWLMDETEDVIWTEQACVGEDYAGRADLLVAHKTYGTTLIDLKTQDVKKGRPVFYDEWRYQCAAYAATLEDPVNIGALIIDKAEPGRVHYKPWTREEQAEGLEAFHAAKTLWRISTGYDQTKARQAA